MCRIARCLLLDIRGATAVEYSLIAALVSMSAIAGMMALGGSLESYFVAVTDVLDAALFRGTGGGPTVP